MRNLSILSVVLLTACTSYNETFDCEPGIGVGCKSLSAINAMVDCSELPVAGEAEETAPEATPSPVSSVPTKSGFRIWIAPQVESSVEGGQC